jgi:methyl acetate hydrolase
LPPITADFDPFPGTTLTHSFGFLRNEVDIPGRRAAGSLAWAGVCNTHYWIDPARDVAAVFMTQSLPFAEARVMRAYEAFERGVYAG